MDINIMFKNLEDSGKYFNDFAEKYIKIKT